MNTDWGANHRCTLARHLLEGYGVTPELALADPDFAHLYEESQRLCSSPAAYADRLRSVAVSRLDAPDFIPVLDRSFESLRSKLLAGAEPHLVAEALQIVAGDVPMIEEIRGYGAPGVVVEKLCDRLVEGALYTAGRLVLNAAGSLKSKHHGPAGSVDESKVRPLGEVIEHDGSTKEGEVDFSSGAPLLVIATAGRGTRLRTTIPKALLPLGGSPLVRGVMDGARAAGIRDIVVVLKHGAELHPPVLGPEHVYVRQSDALGTGHSFAAALRHCARHAGACVLSYSDTPFLSPASFRKVIEPVERCEAAMTVLAVSSKEMPEFGQLKEGDGRVRYIGQPRFGFQEGGRADGGLYALRLPDALPALLSTENRNHRYEYSFTEIVSRLDAEGRLVRAISVSDPREVLGLNRPADMTLARRMVHEFRAALAFYRRMGADVRDDLSPPELLEFASRCDERVRRQVGAVLALDDVRPPAGEHNV